ncbi:hypothetical protein AMS68_007650 [Peltaster fructicola]|uniref:Uncharacterized protein n=1 Tax=Peltaster fructicola TaxID=286661 RepID=A0A6H0Y555_9PEZI|nr:hypothetical protein AMS68_007650 [Peltaster fructicola]
MSEGLAWPSTEVYDFPTSAMAMNREGQVVVIYVTSEAITSGLLRRLAAEGATLALVLPATLQNDHLSALVSEVSQLEHAAVVTMHRETAAASTGFQSTIADVLRQHKKLDTIITEDGEVISQSWIIGSDEEKTQMLVYAAFTSIQARQLQRRLLRRRG